MSVIPPKADIARHSQNPIQLGDHPAAAIMRCCIVSTAFLAAVLGDRVRKTT
jgi:hypothetical protein